ncbi:GH14242, partial [Drosophila grimshawi]
ALWCDRTIALKEFRLERNSQSVLDSFNKELKMLESVHHENIVKLYGTSSHLETDYLLMEYAENGSLHDYLHGEEQRNYTMEDGIHWMIQLVKGMDYLHGRKPMPIIHRDLRPQNLLLTKNCKQLKIAHFGTGKELMTKNTTRIGTPGYLAPEVIQGLKYTEKCDTYSFGIIVWEVMSRRRPFDHLESRNTIVLLHKTVLKERPKLDVKLITDCNQLIELIESCWNHDPEKRPSAGSIQLSEIPCSDIYIVKPENQKN